MEQADFVNMYIVNLATEVAELTKTKILLMTKEKFKEAEVEELKKKISELENAVVIEKDETTKAWKATLEEKEQKTQDTVADLKKQLQNKDLKLASHLARIDEMHRDLKDKENIIASLNEQLNRMTEKKTTRNVRKKKPDVNIVL